MTWRQHSMASYGVTWTSRIATMGTPPRLAPSSRTATPRRRLSRSRRAHFEKALTIAPRYKRAIFYSGEAFHSGHVDAPDLMANDPLTGRLTVNAFFRRQMAAG